MSDLVSQDGNANCLKTGISFKPNASTLLCMGLCLDMCECFVYAKDVQKAKQFLPFLQRAGKTEALVEFVASGSRLRLYIPKETCLITLLLSGICNVLSGNITI